MHKRWYRIKRGFIGEPALGVIAQRSGLSRAESAALYLCLLDAAAVDKQLDSEEVSILLGIEKKRIEAGIKAFCDKKMISEDKKVPLSPPRPSASTLRVRALRAKRKEAQTHQEKIRPGQPRPDPDSPEAIAARRARLGSALSPHSPSKTT